MEGDLDTELCGLGLVIFLSVTAYTLLLAYYLFYYFFLIAINLLNTF